MKIINPATEEVIGEIQEDTGQTLDKKFQLLKVAQSTWQQIDLKERIRIIKKFGSLLEEKKEALATVLTGEVGKPLQQSRNELGGAQARIKWLTENAAKYLSDEIMTDETGMQEKIS